MLEGGGSFIGFYRIIYLEAMSWPIFVGDSVHMLRNIFKDKVEPAEDVFFFVFKYTMG